MNEPQTTIKQHLELIRKTAWDCDITPTCCAKIIEQHLAAIEAAIDRPINNIGTHYLGRRYKPSEIVSFEIDAAEARSLTGGHSIRCRVHQIRAIQSDAIASNSPQASSESHAQTADLNQQVASANASRDAQNGGVIDLRILAEETTLKVLVTGEENTQDIIHAALLKARGGAI